MWTRAPVGSPLGKLSIMLKDAKFLGLKGTTSEIISGAGAGIYRTRSIRRSQKKKSGVGRMSEAGYTECRGESLKVISKTM